MKKFLSRYWKIISFSLLLFFAFVFFMIIKFPLYSKAIEVDIEHQAINIDNKFPISDALGKTLVYSKNNKDIQGYTNIIVHNPNDRKVSFSIILLKNNLEISEIKENYVKLYLTDKNDNPINGFEKNMVPCFSDLKRYNNSYDRILYKGVIDKNNKFEFILRSWISDSYVISNNLEKFSYNIRVVI